MPKGKIGAAVKAIAEDVAKGMEDATASTEKLATEGADGIDAAVKNHQLNDQAVKEKLEAAGGNPEDATAISRDSHFLHSDADPLRKHGPARETHPAEWDAAMREADESGVEVLTREGAMAYGPAPSAGRPGQLIIDPDASYGALLHEMSHLRDDRDAGWQGMAAAFGDNVDRYQNEARAYQAEIDYARSIGDQDAVDRLHELLRQEYEYIFGEAP